jgi:hypothetical protein
MSLRLEDSYSENPVKELEGLLGNDWRVTQNKKNEFVCRCFGTIYMISTPFKDKVYQSSLLTIVRGAKQQYEELNK